MTRRGSSKVERRLHRTYGGAILADSLSKEPGELGQVSGVALMVPCSRAQLTLRCNRPPGYRTIIFQLSILPNRTLT